MITINGWVLPFTWQHMLAWFIIWFVVTILITTRCRMADSGRFIDDFWGVVVLEAFMFGVGLILLGVVFAVVWAISTLFF